MNEKLRELSRSKLGEILDCKPAEQPLTDTEHTQWRCKGPIKALVKNGRDEEVEELSLAGKV